ncbi:MAG: peroxidase [Chloroflexi bacterium]|nr:peroxidase [Chloroflexota bacterium]
MPNDEATIEAWKPTLDEAGRLIDAGDYAAATAVLQCAPERAPSGESDALLALALFQQGDYAAAVTAYSIALEAQPANPDWSEMLGRAHANAASEIQVQVPEVYYYDREKLLAPPSVPAGALPAPPDPIEVTFGRKALRVAGDALGFGVSAVVDGVTQLVGRGLGYRDEVWTNWYRRRLTIGILTLGYMRTRLNRFNLRSTYPGRTLVGFQRRGLTPPPGVTHFRTADGSWNNLQNPKEGAAGTRFPRNVRIAAIRPETGAALLTPNPREISRKLLTRPGEMKEVPFLNMLAASWINFQNHDWISHGQNLSTGVHEIPLAPDDPARLRYRQQNLFVGKTQPDPTRRPAGERTPITFINEVTHWWDGSQIYGSDQATVDRLRSHADGKLRLNGDGTLPVGANGVEESGFVRDWWVGLSMLHTLFAREHNAICDMLKASYPEWEDNRLFNVARLINAAVMAKIHSVEWTPAILPNATLAEALNANWYGVLTNVFRRGAEKKTLANFNVRNPEMGGVVGNPVNNHGQPYGLTEEFVEVYRLHSLLPETLAITTRSAGPAATEDVPFPATRQAGSPKLTKRVPMADLFYSFGNQHPGQLVLNNYPRFMQELSIPGNPLFDMGAVDILRARERGVPRYNEFRRQLGLNPVRSWEDLTSDPDHLAALKETYGARAEDVERLDLLVGTLAEETRPTGFGFGETLFQIFILNASRRLQADRFFTDCYNAETYTQKGLDWIDRADLKHVILRHYPELAATGLANIKNAFEPWDEGRLDSTRHPLRAFDKELKPDPWRGDAAKG